MIKQMFQEWVAGNRRRTAEKLRQLAEEYDKKTYLPFYNRYINMKNHPSWFSKEEVATAEDEFIKVTKTHNDMWSQHTKYCSDHGIPLT